MKTSIIQEKSFSFALQIIELYKFMAECHEYVLSKQLLKSGTSIGANVVEASAAISRKDFINKMAIASKEARETEYWLRLFIASRIVDYDFSTLLNNIVEIVRILTSIIKTSQEK